MLAESRTYLTVFAKYLGGTILNMKMGAVLRAMFVLAAFSMAGQVTAGILVDVRFNEDSRLDGVDLQKCTTDLRSQNYAGQQWTDYLLERVRTLCLQNQGYFKAVDCTSLRFVRRFYLNLNGVNVV